MADVTLHEKMMQMHGDSGESRHKMPAMKKATFEVALKNKKQIAEGTFAFTFEKPKKFTFKAGQHIRMTLLDPPETDNEGNSRFFSLANTPQDIDLVIAMRMRDTAFKRNLGRMQTRDKVLIEILLDSPHGSFSLHKDSSKPAIFIIGGIGIVPAFSIIKDASQRNLSHPMYLFYSNRRPEDAPFLNELKLLAKQNPSFKLIATMTEIEKSAVNWHGETGHIDYAMLNKYISELSTPIYYVAGLPEMASAMKTMLVRAGVNQENIHSEEFTGFNLNDVHEAANRSKKSFFTLALIALAIITFVILHTTAATSLFQAGFGSFSFNNPMSYLAIGTIIVIVAIKFKFISMGFRHGLVRKSTAKNPKKNRN